MWPKKGKSSEENPLSGESTKSLDKEDKGSSGGSDYAKSKSLTDGLMDIALLSANASHLRLLLTYNLKEFTNRFSLGLVIASLALQVLVGIGLIFKRTRKNESKSCLFKLMNELLIMGVFLITVINVLLAVFGTTEKAECTGTASNTTAAPSSEARKGGCINNRCG